MPRFSLGRRAQEQSDWADRHPAQETPWTHEYNAAHRALVTEAINDEDLCRRVAAGSRLPAGFGAGFDERTIEYPWLLGQRPSERVLDAGSTLNHEHILDRVQPMTSSITIVTLAPEETSFTSRGVSYLYEDLRELPFRDGWFDTVISLSTLEHVGMDNAVYGAEGTRAADPAAEVTRAARELRRVTKPGGRILVSVPFGAREDHGWFRQFGPEDVDHLVDAFQPRTSAVTVFRYDRTGWNVSTPIAAADEKYRDFTVDPSPVPDLAAAARAVACVAMDV